MLGKKSALWSANIVWSVFKALRGKEWIQMLSKAENHLYLWSILSKKITPDSDQTFRSNYELHQLQRRGDHIQGHWKNVISNAVSSLKVKVAQLSPTLYDPMDYTVHGILQARIPEWVAYPFCSGSSQPRNRTRVSCIAGVFFTTKATRKAQVYPITHESNHHILYSSVPWISRCYFFSCGFKKRTLILGRSSWSWKIESQGLLLFTFLW